MFTPFLNIGITDVVDILLVTMLLYIGVVMAQAHSRRVGLVRYFRPGRGLSRRARSRSPVDGVDPPRLLRDLLDHHRSDLPRGIAPAVRARGDVEPLPAKNDPARVRRRGHFDPGGRRLGSERIGALMVFPGKHPIGRHISGGIELGGTISVPLLKSIFDPHSPGHDGAVIIEGDRSSVSPSISLIEGL